MLRTRPTQHRRRSSAASRATARDQKSQSRRASLLPTAGDNGVSSDDVAESSRENANQESRLTPEPLPSAPKEIDSPSSDIDLLTTGMASLKFVPRSIRFGRGGCKGGFAKS